MKESKKSKVDIELGRITKTEFPYSPTFYIGFSGMILYRDGRDYPDVRHSYTAYAEDFFSSIYLAGGDITPHAVFGYMQVCKDYARLIGQEMKRHGITGYELKNGSPDTGIVFDESIDQFAYLRTDSAKMDPIPDDGIELFRKTLEECLKPDWKIENEKKMLVVHEQNGKNLVELLEPEYTIIVVDKAVDTIKRYLGIDCEKPEISGIIFQAEKYDRAAPWGTQNSDIISCGVAAMELRGYGFTGAIVIYYDVADKLDESIGRYLSGRVQKEAHLISNDEDARQILDYLKHSLE